eukprot:1161821-Rhodomonas_salina.1
MLAPDSETTESKVATTAPLVLFWTVAPSRISTWLFCSTQKVAPVSHQRSTSTRAFSDQRQREP